MGSSTGSSMPFFKDIMGQSVGMNPQPAPQVSPQIQQSQGATQDSQMNPLLQMLMNSMMGIKGGNTTQQPQQPQMSARDMLIQSLMGGGYGR